MLIILDKVIVTYGGNEPHKLPIAAFKWPAKLKNASYQN